MISLNNISLYFGGQTIFNNISLMINKGDKIGLVGKNGVGKSTLLKVINHEQSVKSGDVNISKNTKIGYLKQDLEFIQNKTIIEEVRSTFVEIEKLEKNLINIRKEMDERSDYESETYLDLINTFNITEERFRLLNGHDIDSKINQILTGLGFLEKDFNKKTSEFSGGWRMRIELAKILLSKPDVLLLDEPTNHLDIESIIWFEKWIKNYNGSTILVSHDKKFLDSITNRTIEISFGELNQYKASYSKFLKLRQDRIIKQIQAKKNQDKYIKETQNLINKFRAKKNKSAFAQSLIKKLSKLEIIQVEKEDVAEINFNFPPAPHSGKQTLSLKNIQKDYNGIEILKNINLKILRGEKLAFVGKNGEGKSTLAKIIVNEIKFKGNVKLGHNVKISYYAQNQTDLLIKQETVFESIYNSSRKLTHQDIRNILGSFLFSDDTVDKKIDVLSGGEKARVALCKLLIEPSNLLIMDEPTNHLDITSKELLKQALLKYNGNLIIISHDREFLEGLTTKVYEFKNKNIKEYIGDINQFLEEKEITNLKSLDISNKKNKTQSNKSEEKTKYLNNKKIKRKITFLKNKINKVEIEINNIEEDLKKINDQLSSRDTTNKFTEDAIVYNKYNKKMNKIKKLENIWTKLQIELDNITEQKD